VGWKTRKSKSAGFPGRPGARLICYYTKLQCTFPIV